MDIAFRTRKLGRVCNSSVRLQREFGVQTGRAIMRRLAVLQAAPNLARVPVTPPERRHQLHGDRDEQFAVDLDRLRRLVFRANHNPVPRNDDDGIDIERVTSITILEVVDYH